MTRAICIFLLLAAATAAFVTVNGTLARAQDQPSLDPRTQQALVTALEDERRAETLYQAVIDRFGSVRPFANIVMAEQRHQQELLWLFEAYGIPVPPPRAREIAVPDTLPQACQLGVESELRNIAMYDEFLAFVEQPDIRATFIRLRGASQDRHLPAFERCVRRQPRGRCCGDSGYSR